MGPQGVKAKYVRVELRKIETLPGGAQNSFYDFVGQSPIHLWQSSEEYSMLHSVSPPLTFFLSLSKVAVSPITRSLGAPPDLSVCQAGIKYELVGQVCVQGKTYVFPFMSITRVYSPPPLSLKEVSSVATSRSFCLPQLPSPSTSTNFIPPGPSSSNTNRATSPRTR